MARRNEHSREALHDLALDAAEALVAREGLEGLTMRRVAKAIGYTVGTLYLVFDNLDDLILQINGRTLDDLHGRLANRQSSGDTPEARLIALASAYIAYAETESPRWNLLFATVSDKHGDLPNWYQEKLGRAFGLVEAALCRLPLPPAAAASMARVLWASVHGICTLKIRQRLELAGGQSAEAMAVTLISNFLRGATGIRENARRIARKSKTPKACNWG